MVNVPMNTPGNTPRTFMVGNTSGTSSSLQGVLTLPGFVGADAQLLWALGPHVQAYVRGRQENATGEHWGYYLGVSRVLQMAIMVWVCCVGVAV